MSIEESLRENAGTLSALGAAAHLRNQSIQNKAILEQKTALLEQNELLKKQAKTEEHKLEIEKQRLELEKQRIHNEQEYRVEQKKLEGIRKSTIKEIRKTLSNAKSSIERLKEELNKF